MKKEDLVKEEGLIEKSMELYNGRPSRSDIHLSFEEEAKLETQARDYYDGIAPKRHSKPQRSEYSSNYVDAFPNLNNNDNTNYSIPECLKFKTLQKDPQKLVSNGAQVTEEFVETEYYKDLNRIDKQHHTTGTGFITVEDKNGDGLFHLQPDADTSCHGPCMCNPATNDWIPSPANLGTCVSDKPNRSES